jgi:signal transduction histidine kinase
MRWTVLHSIRKQLTLRILAGTLLMLLLAGVVFCVVVRSRVVAEFDRALEAKARALVALTSREGRVLDIDIDEEAMPEFAASDEDDDGEDEEEDGDDDRDDEDEEPEYFEIRLRDGAAVRKSQSLGGGSLPFELNARRDRLFRSLRLRDGDKGRLVQVTFAPAVEEADEGEDDDEDDEDCVELPVAVDEDSLELVLVVARSREDLDELLGFLYLAFALLSVALLAGIAALVRSAMRRGFQPLDAVNAQVRDIGPESLDGRIRLASPPEELAPIVEGLNGLLGRVEDGFARERRFSNDVAHELRTPVAELRTACEVGAKWPDDPRHTQQFFADIEDIARQMERVVANLLELTRCDSGTSAVIPERIPLRQMVEDCWRRAAGDASANHLHFENRVEQEATVTTDRGKLQMILQNTVDNAVFHSARKSVVSCRTERSDTGGLALILANKAQDLARGDLAHVFERFWRKDIARTGGRHSGLGLSLVRDLARVLGIDVRVDLREGNVFVVTMVFRDTADRKRAEHENAGTTPGKREEKE